MYRGAIGTLEVELSRLNPTTPITVTREVSSSLLPLTDHPGVSGAQGSRCPPQESGFSTWESGTVLSNPYAFLVGMLHHLVFNRYRAQYQMLVSFVLSFLVRPDCRLVLVASNSSPFLGEFR